MAQTKEQNHAPAPANASGEKRPRTSRRPHYTRRPRRPQQPKEAATPIHIYPLGGLGEVGKNMTVYECCGDMIIVDCGLVFPDNDMFGVDMVIPDFTFVVQNKDKIKGLLITHGHEDHIGSIPYLLQKFDLPIYGTRLTCGLIRNKLEEFGLAGKTKFVEITPRQKLKLGCFTVEPIHVNHSIPDAVAFAIDSPAGTIIQTGDFKIDYTPLACGPTDLATLSEYGQKGVLALLSDSTNAERPGFTATEQKVAAGVRSLFARAQNKRIIIATFASNIYRVQQIIDLAVEDGRKVAFSGRSMVNNTAMAQELGYMHIPEGTLISIDEINQYPPEQVVLVTTGSQGEPLSALSRMASCSHRQVRVGPGDFIIISAKPIPGNEKSVTKIVNGLLLLGAEVIYEGMYDVHVSGHACQEEQKLMLTLTRPKYFLPVHGEYKQLKKHAITAASLGIPTSNILIAENGSNIILSQDEMKGEPVTAGAVMVDGLGVGDVGNVVLRDRKHLSEDGLVIIVATVDSKTGKVLAGPDLVSRGFVYVRENESLMDGAQSIVETALDRCVDEHVRDWNSVKTRVREALSSYIYRRTKRSPMILPILMEV
jgi:ribonuclease J